MQFSAKLLTPILLAITLAACGGSSSSDSSTADGLKYSGKSTPADFSNLSTEQKKTLAQDSAVAVSAALDSSSFSDFDLGTVIGAQATRHLPAQTLAKREANLALAHHKETQSMGLALAASADSAVNCIDSGTRTISGNADESTGKGSLTIVMKDCVEYGETTSGKITFKGDGKSTQITFDNLRSKSADYNYSLNGYLKFSGNLFAEDESENANMNFEWSLKMVESGVESYSKGSIEYTNGNIKINSLVKENSKTYSVEMTQTGNSYEIKISHPDYGSYEINAKITDKCEDEDGFVGTLTIKDEKGNTITYKSTSCNGEPTIE